MFVSSSRGSVSAGVADAPRGLPAARGVEGRTDGASRASPWPGEAVGKAPADITGLAEVCHNLRPNYADVLIRL